jgi:hypothetical protein
VSPFGASIDSGRRLFISESVRCHGDHNNHSRYPRRGSARTARGTWRTLRSELRQSQNSAEGIIVEANFKVARASLSGGEKSRGRRLGRLSSLAQQVQDNRPPVRRSAMLEHIDPLPCSERRPAVDDRNRQLRAGERGPYVRGHVVRPFHRVAIQLVVFRRERLKWSLRSAITSGSATRARAGSTRRRNWQSPSGLHSAAVRPPEGPFRDSGVSAVAELSGVGAQGPGHLVQITSRKS